ncbi:hypothetical protein LUZ62_062332 [Rhynchospora pubera]|uniref:Uncharacterized protein n=1 Tax=Rhynchospora pubera TaxID=906938 RepID=A0AAV8ECZ1_9POAL|nr:hypothetical protein LUZ62_062332 [Rhynchospora pubera]
MALEKNVLIVSIIGGVLGSLSVLLGYSAEGTRTRFSDLYVLSGGGCVHENGPAFGLALGAAFLLLIAQIIISVFLGCGCCSRNGQQSAKAGQAGNKRTTSIIMFCTSWVTFAISFIIFILGAMIEAKGANGNVDENCAVVIPGRFAIAATLALATVSLSVGAYTLLKSTNGTNHADGIAIGVPSQTPQTVAPQFPPQKPVNHGQEYYPPPGTVPQGYGYNTQSYA